MNNTTPLGFLGICLAFAVTAFLGGMAGSLLLNGDDDGATASPPAAQPTVQGTPRPLGSVTPLAAASVVAPAVSPTVAAATTPGTTPAAGTPTPAAGGATYTVVAGDTLSGIAVKQNVPADQRQAWIQQVQTLNNLTATAILQIGQVLKLPPAGAATTPAAGSPTATRPAGTAPAGTAPAGTATRTP